MTTLERLYEMYLEEKNEKAETGAVYQAMSEYRRTLGESKEGTDARLQAMLWDCFVMYGDAREKDGFVAGFKMAMDLAREMEAKPNDKRYDIASGEQGPIKLLDVNECGELFKALVEYRWNKTLPENMSRGAEIAFTFIKTRLDEDNERIERQNIARRENGKKGGRPKKIVTTEETELPK